MPSPVRALLPIAAALSSFLLVVHSVAGPSSTTQGSSSPAPVVAAPGWFSAAWRYRVQIMANPALVSGVLLDIPLLLDGGPLQSVFPRAEADGRDIVITKRDGVTILPHEIASYNAGQGKAQVWFAPDSLSSAVNGFFVYYDNPNANVTSPRPVWSDDYVAVYHFEDNPGLGTLRDASTRAAHASTSMSNAGWTSADVSAGQVGQSLVFNGTTHYVSADDISTQDSSFVISCWLDNTTQTVDFAFQANPGFWHVSSQINSTHSRPHYNAANPWRDFRWGPHPLPRDGAYHYFTWAFDGVADTMLFYFDGVPQPATPWWKDPGVQRYYTGHAINPTGTEDVGIVGPMFHNSEDLMNGRADEFRVSEGLHSPGWIATEYQNQKSPSAFFSAAAEEEVVPNAVFLLWVEVARVEGGAELTWRVGSTSADHAGFHVYRADDGGSRVRLTTALLSGASSYRFVDPHPPSGPATYWLGETSTSGTTTWYGPVHLQAATVAGFALEQNHPNPCRSTTHIRFTAGSSGRAVLRIIDVRGREVRRLWDRVVAPGSYRVTWDGRDSRSQRVNPGIYLYSLETPRGVFTRKLVVL